MLKRLAKEVVICFDADNAGQNAAQRAIDVLLKEDVQVRIARIPQGEDPDSLLRKQPVRGLRDDLARGEGLHAASARRGVRAGGHRQSARARRGRAKDGAGHRADSERGAARGLSARGGAAAAGPARGAGGGSAQGGGADAPRRSSSSRDYPSATGARRRGAKPPRQAEPQEPIQARQVDRGDAVAAARRIRNWCRRSAGSLIRSGWRVSAARRCCSQLLDAHAHDAFENARAIHGRMRRPHAGLSRGPAFPAPPVPTKATPEAYADKLVAQSREALEAAAPAGAQSRRPNPTSSAVEERLKYLMEIQAIRRQFPDLEP